VCASAGTQQPSVHCDAGGRRADDPGPLLSAVPHLPGLRAVSGLHICARALTTSRVRAHRQAGMTVMQSALQAARPTSSLFISLTMTRAVANVDLVAAVRCPSPRARSS
jgi:hypothetical protein